MTLFLLCVPFGLSAELFGYEFVVEADELLGFVGDERRFWGVGYFVFEEGSMQRGTVLDGYFDCG